MIFPSHRIAALLFFGSPFAIRAADSPVQPQVQPFPLAGVRLLAGPFKTAQDVNARYLLDVVDADRLLAGFRAQAKLPEKAQRYGGSELDWKERGIKLRQETAFPDADTVRFTFEAAKPTKFALKIRHPFWCALPEVKVNGEAVAVNSTPSSYFTIDREWKSGDVVELRLPMALRAEALPHSDGKIVSVLYGPNLLAGIVPAPPGAPDPARERWDDHLEAPGRVEGTPPVFVAESAAALLAHFQPTGKAFAEFRTEGVVQPNDLVFMPLHRVYEEHYAVYLPFVTPAEWGQREGEIRAAGAVKAELDAATVDTVQPGFQQSEVEHNFRSVNSETGPFRDRKWRDAKSGGWFSYEVVVDPAKPMALVGTYWGTIVIATSTFSWTGKKSRRKKSKAARAGNFSTAFTSCPRRSPRENPR